MKISVVALTGPCAAGKTKFFNAVQGYIADRHEYQPSTHQNMADFAKTHKEIILVDSPGDRPYHNTGIMRAKGGRFSLCPQPHIYLLLADKKDLFGAHALDQESFYEKYKIYFNPIDDERQKLHFAVFVDDAGHKSGAENKAVLLKKFDIFTQKNPKVILEFASCFDFTAPDLAESNMVEICHTADDLQYRGAVEALQSVFAKEGGARHQLRWDTIGIEVLFMLYEDLQAALTNPCSPLRVVCEERGFFACFSDVGKTTRYEYLSKFLLGRIKTAINVKGEENCPEHVARLESLQEKTHSRYSFS